MRAGPELPAHPAASQEDALPDFLQYLVFRVLEAAAMALPYRLRVPAFGWVVARIVGPIARFGQRTRANLVLIYPDMPQAELDRLARAVSDNFGRTLMEVYSGERFKRHVAQTPISGDGLPALEEATRSGRAVVFVSGHLGNYDVLRAYLAARGQPVGALYRPFPNPYFDRRYRAKITAISGPIFPRGRRGLAEMVKHLRGGGMVGMLIDQHMAHGAALQFMGHTALTATSAAEMALKYDALLLPTYGVRRPDGLTFDLIVEAPIARSTPEAMTQALNDSLERQVRAHPEQWMWVARRWGRPGRHG